MWLGIEVCKLGLLALDVGKHSLCGNSFKMVLLVFVLI